MPKIEVSYHQENSSWPSVQGLLRPIWEIGEEWVPLDKPIEISLVLSDDAHIRPLNREYRSKDMPTNVLSFPQLSFTEGILTQQWTLPFYPLGDIILSYDTIMQEAIAQKKTWEDHLKHLTIHGFLHLIGFDHLGEEDASRMENIEIVFLDRLGVKNPYVDFSAV